MITFKNKYDGSLVMSQQTHAQEVTSHFPVARLVTIGHFQSEQSLVVVAQWEEHALSVSHLLNMDILLTMYVMDMKLFMCVLNALNEGTVSLFFIFYYSLSSYIKYRIS